ncbi:hypothetical protein EXS84_02600 [Helicobacter pylori]|nr:hypothetical protein [Helicobacter pylori]
MNFLKFYYRIFNKKTNPTPTTQQENFFKACEIKRAWTLKLYKIPIILYGHRARTKPPNFNFFNH